MKGTVDVLYPGCFKIAVAFSIPIFHVFYVTGQIQGQLLFHSAPTAAVFWQPAS